MVHRLCSNTSNPILLPTTFPLKTRKAKLFYTLATTEELEGAESLRAGRSECPGPISAASNAAAQATPRNQAPTQFCNFRFVLMEQFQLNLRRVTDDNWYNYSEIPGDSGEYEAHEIAKDRVVARIRAYQNNSWTKWSQEFLEPLVRIYPNLHKLH